MATLPNAVLGQVKRQAYEIYLYDGLKCTPENGTGGLIGNQAVPLLNGADNDEENETAD